MEQGDDDKTQRHHDGKSIRELTQRPGVFVVESDRLKRGSESVPQVEAQQNERNTVDSGTDRIVEFMDELAIISGFIGRVAFKILIS